MARQRSPNYPSRDLESAIQDVGALYNKEGKAVVDSETAVKAWGYASLSGLARSRLAAIKHYGLIGKHSGKVQVTDRATTLLLRLPETTEWQAAVRAAALEPEVFRDLNERFPGHGSDDAIRAYLIQEKDFTRDGADSLISSYRATAEYAKLTEPEPQTIQGEQPSGHGEVRARMIETPGTTQVQTWSWPLSSTVFAEVNLRGVKISPEDLDTLTDYLAVAKKALERQAKQGDDAEND